ncbi:hypothetical protein V6N13_068782 [Hibiscus sabdariffa]
MKLPSTFVLTFCFVSMKLPENAHKQAFKKKETLAPEVMEKTITVLAAVTRFSEQMTRYRACNDFFDSLSCVSLAGGSPNERMLGSNITFMPSLPSSS